jgi:hypothetical protein
MATDSKRTSVIPLVVVLLTACFVWWTAFVSTLFDWPFSAPRISLRLDAFYLIAATVAGFALVRIGQCCQRSLMVAVTFLWMLVMIMSILVFLVQLCFYMLETLLDWGPAG